MTSTNECGNMLVENPRMVGEALIQLANVQDTKQRLQQKLMDVLPLAEVGEAVTTKQRSVSIRNALDMIRHSVFIPYLDFCALLREWEWVKFTAGDKTHRPTMEAIKAGYVERVYFSGNRGYRPAITPTGIELLKYAIGTRKYDVLRITKDRLERSI